MQLVLRQYGKVLKRLPRPATDPEIVDADEIVAAAAATELLTAGTLEVGYYDLELRNGAEIVDHVIQIA